MIRKFFYFFRIPIVFYLFNLIINWMGVYLRYPWIDIPMHFLGGAAVAYSFVLIFKFAEKKNWMRINNRLVFVFIILSSVALIAVLWEFYEYIIIHLLKMINVEQNLKDTILDLFMGLCGGLFVGLVTKN